MTQVQSNVALKTRVKYLLQRVLRPNLPPLIVASMGRSGSTLVVDALREAMSQARFPKALHRQGLRIVADEAWDLDRKTFRPGVVYKTHGLADELPEDSGAQVVFLFGSALDAALSVLACRDRYPDGWITDHFDHLRASGSFDDLGHWDVLRFGEQLDGWIGKSGTRRMILHYDALWDNEDKLAEFTGVPLRLPPRRERTGATSADAKNRARFAKTYAALDARIAAMPRCQVLE